MRNQAKQLLFLEAIIYTKTKLLKFLDAWKAELKATELHTVHKCLALLGFMEQSVKIEPTENMIAYYKQLKDYLWTLNSWSISWSLVKSWDYVVKASGNARNIQRNKNSG